MNDGTGRTLPSRLLDTSAHSTGSISEAGMGISLWTVQESRHPNEEGRLSPRSADSTPHPEFLPSIWPGTSWVEGTLSFFRLHHFTDNFWNSVRIKG